MDKLARDLVELGTIHQLRFDWSKALEAFHEAWRLKQDPEYGFKYAHFAQQQHQFRGAGETYGTVLAIYRELAKANLEAFLPDVARTLNNLAILYSARSG